MPRLDDGVQLFLVCKPIHMIGILESDLSPQCTRQLIHQTRRRLYTARAGMTVTSQDDFVAESPISPRVRRLRLRVTTDCVHEIA